MLSTAAKIMVPGGELVEPDSDQGMEDNYHRFRRELSARGWL